MTQDEIIRMAREAGMTVFVIESLERFAALVAAHERNRHAWTQEHWTEYEHAIAAAAREACAKVCEELKVDPSRSKNKTPDLAYNLAAHNCAAAIREIGEKK